MGATVSGNVKQILKRSPPRTNNKCGGELTKEKGFPLLCDYPLGELVAFEFSKIFHHSIYIPEVQPFILNNENFESHLEDYPNDDCATGNKELYLGSKVMELLELTFEPSNYKLGLYSGMAMEPEIVQLPDIFLRSVGRFVMERTKGVDSNKLMQRWETKDKQDVFDTSGGKPELFDQVVDAFAFDFLVGERAKRVMRGRASAASEAASIAIRA